MTQSFDRSHCEAGCADYTCRVLVLAPQALCGKDVSPDNQLFVAEAGCGCSPATRGRKVFGQFLKTGECAQFERRDFLGVLKKKYLPPWAGGRLADIEIQDNLLTGKLLK